MSILGRWGGMYLGLNLQIEADQFMQFRKQTMAVSLERLQGVKWIRTLTRALLDRTFR